jgi:hypothetical protein
MRDAFGVEIAKSSPTWVRDAAIATGSGLAASVVANQLPQNQQDAQKIFRRRKRSQMKGQRP